MASTDLIKAVAVTAELCGRVFSPEAAAVFVSDLSVYPEGLVIAALARCRKEVRGVLTISDVVSRIDDGRPGVEEAFAMLPKREADSVVWTVEMAQAFGTCAGMMDAGDVVAARMAFKETYSRLVAQARDKGEPVQWYASLGHDPRGRDGALSDAVQKGRLSYAHARYLSPTLPAPTDKVLGLTQGAVKLVGAS